MVFWIVHLGFFLKDDGEPIDLLTNYDFGVQKGTHKIKFDTTEGEIPERIEFESAPIYITESQNALVEFDNFARGIQTIIGYLKNNYKKVEHYFTVYLIDILIKKLTKARYNRNEYKTDKWKIQVRLLKEELRKRKKDQVILNNLKELSINSFTGTAQVTFGIPLSGYPNLLQVAAVPKLVIKKSENIFNHFLLSVLILGSKNLHNLKSKIQRYSKGHKDDGGPTYVFEIDEHYETTKQRLLQTSRLAKIFLLKLPWKYPTLYNFLFLINNYAQTIGFTKYFLHVDGEHYPRLNYTLEQSGLNTGLKGFFPLMLRNKFSDIYKKLLSKKEKFLFNIYQRLVENTYLRMEDFTFKNKLNTEQTLRTIGIITKEDSDYRTHPMNIQVPLIDDDQIEIIRNEWLIRYDEWLKSMYDPNVRENNHAKYIEELRKRGRNKYTFSYRKTESDLLSPPFSYENMSSRIGGGRFAMGAYPITNNQVLFECRECMSGNKRASQFKTAGETVIKDFVENVCSKLPARLSISSRKRKRMRKMRGSRVVSKVRKRKNSRKRRSVKKKKSRVLRKRRSVKKKKSRKRRSVKKKKSRKRRSVKKKKSRVLRKRRTMKKKNSRKRRSMKKKNSRAPH